MRRTVLCFIINLHGSEHAKILHTGRVKHPHLHALQSAQKQIKEFTLNYIFISQLLVDHYQQGSNFREAAIE